MKKSLPLIVLLAACVAAPVAAAAETKDADKSKQATSEDLDAKLSAAQERLEAAAKEVTELSAKLAVPVIDHLMVLGQPPSRALIGVQLDPNSGKAGARVTEVSPGGAASEAGVRAGDVIISLNGEKVSDERSARQVTRLVRDIEPQSKVKMRVLRDGKPKDFELTARPGMGYFVGGTPPLPPDAPGIPAMPLPPPGLDIEDGIRHFTMSFRDDVAGMELATLTPTLGKYFGTDKGVLVIRAPERASFKLEDGDVILSIGGRVPTSGSHATRILRSYQPGEKIELKVMRQQRPMNLEVTLPEALKEPRRGRDVIYRRFDDAAGTT